MATTTKKIEGHVDEETALEFLASTLREMKDSGIPLAAKNVPATADREAGIIIYVGRARLDPQDGSLTYATDPVTDPVTDPPAIVD